MTRVARLPDALVSAGTPGHRVVLVDADLEAAPPRRAGAASASAARARGEAPAAAQAGGQERTTSGHRVGTWRRTHALEPYRRHEGDP